MHYFLDSNAHTPLNLSKKQIKKINKNIGIYGNPNSPNSLGQKAASIIENSREKIAELLGAKNSNQIFFTNSCTEANYWAMLVMAQDYLKHYDDKILPKIKISPYEHSSITECLNILPGEKTELKLDELGKIKCLNKSDYSIFVGVQNETGIIADFQKIRENTSKLFMSDMSQAVGKIPINLTKMEIDIATFGAHKFGGPSGVGFLYLRNPDLWCPIFNGKAYGFDRPGSMNVKGIYETKFALENCLYNSDNLHGISLDFKNTLIDFLMLKGFAIVGHCANRVPSTILAKVPGGKGLELLMALSNRKIYVGLGSACGSMIEQPLKAAIALGYENAKNTEFIRISQYGNYGEDAAYNFIETLKEALAEIQKEEK